MINYKNIFKKIQKNKRFNVISKLTIYYKLINGIHKQYMSEDEGTELVDLIYNYYINCKNEDLSVVSITKIILKLNKKYNNLSEIIRLLKAKDKEFIKEMEELQKSF